LVYNVNVQKVVHGIINDVVKILLDNLIAFYLIYKHLFKIDISIFSFSLFCLINSYVFFFSVSLHAIVFFLSDRCTSGLFHGSYVFNFSLYFLSVKNQIDFSFTYFNDINNQQTYRYIFFYLLFRWQHIYAVFYRCVLVQL
jgi:hypothetical protein